MPVDADSVVGPPVEHWDPGRGHMTHFATCTDPNAFRKTKKQQEEEWKQ